MREQLERIYLKYRQGLFTLALSITRCPGSAEDAVHDAFARLFRSGTRPGADAVAYVFAAVRNAAIDRTRRRSLKIAPLGECDPSIFAEAGPGPEGSALLSEQRQLLRQAIDALPEIQREAIVLHLYADLTFDQIAQVLGLPLQTVASRYRRGLQRLREAMRVSYDERY